MQLQFTQEELDTLRGEKGSVENKRRSSTASSTGYVQHRMSGDNKIHFLTCKESS